MTGFSATATSHSRSRRRKLRPKDVSVIDDRLTNAADGIEFFDVHPLNASTVSVKARCGSWHALTHVKVKPAHQRDSALCGLLVQVFNHQLPKSLRGICVTYSLDGVSVMAHAWTRASSTSGSPLTPSACNQYVFTRKSPAFQTVLRKFKDAVSVVSDADFQAAKERYRQRVNGRADENARAALKEACKRFFGRGFSLSEARKIMGEILIEIVHET